MDVEKIEEITKDIYGETIDYRNNPRLKRANAEIALRPEHLEEIYKAMNDPFYFAETYFYIIHLDHGKIRIPLRDYQRAMIQNFMDNRFTINLTSRQSGKCHHKDTKMMVRNKDTGEEMSVTAEEFYEMIEKENL